MATKKRAAPAEELLICAECDKPAKILVGDDGLHPKCAAKKNRQRAANAQKGVSAYKRTGGLRGEGLDTVLSYMLCDLAHLCDQKGVDLGECLTRGRNHYNAETQAELQDKQLFSA